MLHIISRLILMARFSDREGAHFYENNRPIFHFSGGTDFSKNLGGQASPGGGVEGNQGFPQGLGDREGANFYENNGLLFSRTIGYCFLLLF